MFSTTKSRIRTKPLPQIMAIARNLALNLYRNSGFNNMAQAYAERYPLGQRQCRIWTRADSDSL